MTRQSERSILEQLELAAIGVDRAYGGLASNYKRVRLMAALQAVIDDSGDENSFVLGGLIAPVEAWREFEGNWCAVCKEPPIIGYYRTNDAISRKGSFANFDVGIRNQKVAKLASVIPADKCYAIAVYLPMGDLEGIKRYYYPFSHPFPYNDPYFLCASCLVAWVCVHSDSLFPRIIKEASEIDFIFDEQGKVGRQFRYFFDGVMKGEDDVMKGQDRMRPRYPRIGKCDHWNDQKFPPLQAADMVAAWVRRGVSSRIQMWTSADVYLSNIELKSLIIDRNLFRRFIGRLKIYRLSRKIK